jgi:GntR family transcriptional regulator
MEPLYQQVAGNIRAQIEQGLLKPGDRLPSTRQLTLQYEVSETVIRFAMVLLKAEGLVYGQPGKGVYVTARE